MSLPITSFTASILALWLIWLSARVIQLRGSENISIGHEGSNSFIRRSRAQANLTEYAPIGLILLGLAEIQGANYWLILACASSLIIGRLLHGYALSFTDLFKFGRLYGMILTFTSIGILALINLNLFA